MPKAASEPVCDWRTQLGEALEEIEEHLGRGEWERQLGKQLHAAYKAAPPAEKRQAAHLLEPAVAYTRKLLIQRRKHTEAVLLFNRQMQYRRLQAWHDGRRGRYLWGWVWWFFGGNGGKSIWGLARFALVPCTAMLLFAWLYSAPISGSPHIEYVNDPRMMLGAPHYLYFSGMTLTTLGYGDMHPKPDDTYGLALAILEAFLGYILLGIFVALLVNYPSVQGPPEDDWNVILFRPLGMDDSTAKSC